MLNLIVKLLYSAQICWRSLLRDQEVAARAEGRGERKEEVQKEVQPLVIPGSQEIVSGQVILLAANSLQMKTQIHVFTFLFVFGSNKGEKTC